MPAPHVLTQSVKNAIGAIMQEILLNIESKEIRCALLKHGALHDLILERKKDRQLTGNIYKGKVSRVLPGMQEQEVKHGFLPMRL